MSFHKRWSSKNEEKTKSRSENKVSNSNIHISQTVKDLSRDCNWILKCKECYGGNGILYIQNLINTIGFESGMNILNQEVNHLILLR